MDEVKTWLKVAGFARKFAEKLERCAELEEDPNTTKEEKVEAAENLVKVSKQLQAEIGKHEQSKRETCRR